MTEEALTADFDRMLSAMTGLPDTKITKPSTILELYPMLHERNATFVVQTHRGKENGFTIFLTIADVQGLRRIVIPPKVAGAVYRQRQSLTDRSTPASRARAAKKRETERRRKERQARKEAYAARQNGKQ